MDIISSYMKSLMDCAAACERCVNGCLNEGQPLSCCKICRDCADICRLCFTLQARQSHYLQELSSLCAEVCIACAEECGKHASMHDHCKVCEEACRACAEACRETSVKEHA